MRGKTLTDDTLITIGQMVKEGYRQKSIAEKLGIHPGVVCRLATGKHRRYNELTAPPRTEG